MSTYRIKKQNNYTVVDNAFIKDNQLSFKAKGILLYLLSRPDNWDVYEADIERQSSDGIRAVRSGIQELIKAGYITRQQKRNDKHRFAGYEYVVHEQPPLLHFAKTENSTQINTDSNQYNIKKDDTAGIAAVKNPFEKQENIFTHVTNQFSHDRVVYTLSVVDWYIDKAYPARMNKKHPEENRAKRMGFAEKLLSCANTTGLDDEDISRALSCAISNCKNCDPTIYWVTTPTVLGYWLIQDDEIEYESVHLTEYAPVETAY